jgi:phosphohistidine swiveling domain-containing protein
MLKKIAQGICVSSGVAVGKAKLITTNNNINSIEEGDILILPNSNPKYATLMMKASAVICENGGRLSHICIVAMEIGIPCITQANNILNKLTDGQIIHVNATSGEISIDE